MFVGLFAKVLSVRGRTNAVVLLQAMHTEAAEPVAAALSSPPMPWAKSTSLLATTHANSDCPAYSQGHGLLHAIRAKAPLHLSFGGSVGGVRRRSLKDRPRAEPEGSGAAVGRSFCRPPGVVSEQHPGTALHEVIASLHASRGDFEQWGIASGNQRLVPRDATNSSSNLEVEAVHSSTCKASVSQCCYVPPHIFSTQPSHGTGKGGQSARVDLAAVESLVPWKDFRRHSTQGRLTSSSWAAEPARESPNSWKPGLTTGKADREGQAHCLFFGEAPRTLARRREADNPKAAGHGRENQ